MLAVAENMDKGSGPIYFKDPLLETRFSSKREDAKAPEEWHILCSVEGFFWVWTLCGCCSVFTGRDWQGRFHTRPRGKICEACQARWREMGGRE